ncbi:MAG TPA: CsbD family protein [Acidimicrobiia bacterium]|nr:CsbD family protein [Acidimicrobiia bacterium]
MDGTTDDLKGRAKEAAGDLTDDDSLKNEGKADRASGKAKDVVADVKDKADEAIDKVKDALHRD